MRIYEAAAGRSEAGAERRRTFARNKNAEAKKKNEAGEAKTLKTRKMNDLAHEINFYTNQKKRLTRVCGFEIIEGRKTGHQVTQRGPANEPPAKARPARRKETSQ